MTEYRDGELMARVRDEVSRRRSRLDIVPAMTPEENTTRLLTLTVAFLSTFAFVLGMLCTGLAMMNRYYGLRIDFVGIGVASWPATSLEINQGEIAEPEPIQNCIGLILFLFAIFVNSIVGRAS